MKRKKLLKKLADFLDRKGKKVRKHRAELEALLRNLRDKELQLEQKMQAEKDKQKRKRLGKEIEIIRAQYAKGSKTLQSLEK